MRRTSAVGIDGAIGAPILSSSWGNRMMRIAVIDRTDMNTEQALRRMKRARIWYTIITPIYDATPKEGLLDQRRHYLALLCMYKFSKELGDLRPGMWQTRHTPGQC